MALNFPLAVSSGTQYLAPNGVTYVFDGYKWVGYPVIQQFSATNGIFNNGYTIQLDGHGNLEFPTYTFPISTGTAGQVLTWPDTGNLLAWVTPQGGSTGTAGGSYLQNVEYRLSLNNDGSITIPNTINAASTSLNFNFVGSYADSAIPAALYTGTTSGTTIYITTSNAFPALTYNNATELFNAVMNGTSGDVVNAPVFNFEILNYDPNPPPGYLYEYSFTITGGQQFHPGHYYILSQPNDIYNIKLSATDDEGGLAPAGVSYGKSNYQYTQSNKGGKVSFQSSTIGNNPNASYSSIIYDGLGGVSLNGSSDNTDNYNGYTQLLWAAEPITTLGQVNYGFPSTQYASLSLQPEITPNGLINFIISPNGNSSLGYTWSMNDDGSMLYPDGTNQYTAWPGSLSRLNLGEGAISVNANGDIIPSNDLISNVGGPFNRINQMYFGNATVYSTPDSVLTINGSTLTNFNTSLSGILHDVVYNTELNQYVAVGVNALYGNLPVAMYSSDGISWNTATSSVFSTPIGGLNNVVVIPIGGRFVATGVDQSNGSTSTFVITSDDGINWSNPQQLTQFPISFNSPTPLVALYENVFMGYNNYTNYESTLINPYFGAPGGWIQIFDQYYSDIYSPTVGLPNQTVGNMFVNGAGQILYFSGDLNNPAYSVSNSYGRTIDYNNTTSNVFLHTACWVPDQYQWLAAGSPKGSYGTLYFYTSQDGVNWTQQTSNIDEFNGFASSIAYNGNTYVVVGINYTSSYKGFIFSSSDGTTWTESGYAVENDTLVINKVIWGNSQFILVAGDSTFSNTRIAVSNNGLTWNEVGVETGTTPSTVNSPWSFNSNGSFTMASGGGHTGVITVPEGWGDNIYFGTNAPSFDGYGITGIGHNAACYGASNNVVAVGSNAGSNNQGSNAIAVGSSAGNQNQGSNSIAIGYNAASSYQPASQIEINATGVSLAGSNTNALYVAPIRSDLTNTTVIIYYNTATNEVTYAPSPTPATSTSTSVPPTNPTLGTTWYDTTTGLVSMWTTDGTSFFWLDVDGPTVSNTTASFVTTYITNNYTTINTGTYYTTQVVLGSRVQVTATTAVLTAGSSSTVSVTGFKGYSLYSMQVNAPAWVSVYTSAAARTADATRSITVDPTPGSGVIAEVVTTQSGITYFTPAIMGFSTESPPTTAIPMKVYNNGSISTTITVTLTLLQLEN